MIAWQMSETDAVGNSSVSVSTVFCVSVSITDTRELSNSSCKSFSATS